MSNTRKVKGPKQPDFFPLFCVPVFRRPEPITMFKLAQMRDAMLLGHGIGSDIFGGIGCDVDVARNDAADRVRGDKIFTHMICIDDDTDFPVVPEKGVIPALRLMMRNLDIVAYPYVGKTPPNRPVLRRRIGERKMAHFADPEDEVNFKRDLEQLNNGGIFKLDGAVGMGFTCISRKVLLKLGEKPFARFSGMAEDVSFCIRALDAGFEIWVDGGVQLAHLGSYGYTLGDFLARLEAAGLLPEMEQAPDPDAQVVLAGS